MTKIFMLLNIKSTDDDHWLKKAFEDRENITLKDRNFFIDKCQFKLK